ncbi:endolysin [Ralstonia phage RSB3]|uniref:Endolysin n=1 Tax=Ralstonia phage RSB3 TaxID=1402875 RepID=U3TK98_9CAUD|nr:endolysin [Ralstonia phage RSB3]BAN92358.1 putative lysozyme [Ralstonia phage RSB3]
MGTKLNAIKSGAIALTLSGLGLTGAFQLVDTFEGNKTSTYLDPLGIPTVCRGTTTGPLVGRKNVTAQECDEQTIKDIQVAAATVRSCVKVPLTLGEYSAWTSFAYNVGPGRKGVKDGMCVLKSGAVPSHLRLLNAGDSRGACKKLFDWTMPGTSVHRGLLARRTAEYSMCVRDLALKED